MGSTVRSRNNQSRHSLQREEITMAIVWLLLILIAGGIGWRLTQVCTMYGEHYQEEVEELVKPDLVINVISSVNDAYDCMLDRDIQECKPNTPSEKVEQKGRF